MKNKAFLTVEVLISIVIIFISIVTMTGSIKLNNNFNLKKDFYEDMYISVRSVQNYIKQLDNKKLENNIKKNIGSMDGWYNYDFNNNSINGFDISIKYKKVKELRNYEFDEFTGGGNIGYTLHILYQFSLDIKKDNYEKNYTFYIHKSKALS